MTAGQRKYDFYQPISHVPEPGGWASQGFDPRSQGFDPRSQGFDPRNWNPQTQGYQNWDPRNSDSRNWESQNGFRNYPLTDQHHYMNPYGHASSHWNSRDWKPRNWESNHQNYISENKVALLDADATKPVHLV